MSMARTSSQRSSATLGRSVRSLPPGTCRRRASRVPSSRRRGSRSSCGLDDEVQRSTWAESRTRRRRTRSHRQPDRPVESTATARTCPVMDATTGPPEPVMPTGRPTRSPRSSVGMAATSFRPRRRSRVSSSRSLFAQARCQAGDAASRTPQPTRSQAPTRPRIDSDPRRHDRIRKQPAGRGKHGPHRCGRPLACP